MGTKSENLFGFNAIMSLILFSMALITAQLNQIEALIIPESNDNLLKPIESQSQEMFARESNDLTNIKRSWNNLHGSWGKRANDDDLNEHNIDEQNSITNDDLLVMLHQPYRVNQEEMNSIATEPDPDEFVQPNKRSLQHIRNFFRKRFNDRFNGNLLIIIIAHTCYFMNSQFSLRSGILKTEMFWCSALCIESMEPDNCVMY